MSTARRRRESGRRGRTASQRCGRFGSAESGARAPPGPRGRSARPSRRATGPRATGTVQPSSLGPSQSTKPVRHSSTCHQNWKLSLLGIHPHRREGVLWIRIRSDSRSDGTDPKERPRVGIHADRAAGGDADPRHPRGDRAAAVHQPEGPCPRRRGEVDRQLGGSWRWRPAPTTTTATTRPPATSKACTRSSRPCPTGPKARWRQPEGDSYTIDVDLGDHRQRLLDRPPPRRRDVLYPCTVASSEPGGCEVTEGNVGVWRR